MTCLHEAKNFALVLNNSKDMDEMRDPMVNTRYWVLQDLEKNLFLIPCINGSKTKVHNKMEVYSSF